MDTELVFAEITRVRELNAQLRRALQDASDTLHICLDMAPEDARLHLLDLLEKIGVVLRKTKY